LAKTRRKYATRQAIGDIQRGRHEQFAGQGDLVFEPSTPLSMTLLKTKVNIILN
jgi:hypothetical protein